MSDQSQAILEAEAQAEAAQPKTSKNRLLFPIMLILFVAGAIVTLWPGIPREMRGVAGLVVMLSGMGLGIPVAMAMALAGGFGLYALVGMPAVISAFESMPFTSAANWTYSVLPMFVLMGAVLWRAGITEHLYTAARAWLKWLPGGLAVATNFAGAGLAAASGSTMAISIALGRIAIPEMLKAGYDRGLAAGTVIMAGTLGQLIPPSILLVIYAGVAEVPVGPLLLAAIVPGVMTAIAYGAMISIRAKINPKLAPPITDTYTWRYKFSTLKNVWPVPLVVFVLIGGMLSGIFTATEAGAVAALSVIVLAFMLLGRRAPRQIGRSVMDTVVTMGGILVLLVGVTLLNRFMTLSGVPMAMSGFVDSLGLGRVEFLLVVMVLYLILGLFLEPLAIMLLTMPILLPTLAALEIDLIFFGIFVVIMGELAIVSPPVGILVFVVHKMINTKEVLGDSPPMSIGTVFAGVTWFCVTQLIVLTVLIFYPEIVHWLPRLAGQ